MANGARVTIDREGCISCGICWVSCPSFFEENSDDNRSQVVAAYRTSGEPAEGLAPPNLMEDVQHAAEGCPVSVIKVED